MSAEIIAVVNQKGGVGKTSVVMSLGVGLVREGYKVLLVDADSQGSLTISAGIREPDELGESLGMSMLRTIRDENFQYVDVIHNEEGFDLIPGNYLTSNVEAELVNIVGREHIMKELLENYVGEYDYILVDCMPSLGMMTVNALAAANSVIIPTQAAYLSIKGLNQLLGTITKVRMRINCKLTVKGIVVTMVDSRTNYARSISDRIANEYGKKLNVFKTVIPLSVRAAESTLIGKSIYEYDPEGKVADAYYNLTKELLNNEK